MFKYYLNMPDGITWAIGIIIVGALVAGFGQLAKGKEGRRTRIATFWIGIAGIGIAILAITGWVPQLGGLNQPIMLDRELAVGEPGVTPPPLAVAVDGCPPGQQVEDTTVTLSAINRFTSVPTGGTHRYRINGAPAKTVSDAGTFTASPGDTLQILWGNETDTSYFGEVNTFTVPCAGTKTFSAELVQNGTITIEVFNEEGNIVAEGTENETLAAGDVVTLEAKIKGQFQKGEPHGGVMIAEFNGSGANPEIDDVIVDFGGVEIPVPAIYSITLGVTSSTKAYSIPLISSNQILVGSVVIDADDANNPSDLAGDIILTHYPYDYFVNEDTGGSFDGPAVEDEDDAATFNHATSFTVHID